MHRFCSDTQWKNINKGKNKHMHFGAVDALASSCSRFACCHVYEKWSNGFIEKVFHLKTWDSGRCLKVNHLKAWQQHYHLRSVRCQDRQISGFACFANISPTFRNTDLYAQPKTTINTLNVSFALTFWQETSKALVYLLCFCFQHSGQRCIHLHLAEGGREGGREGRIWWGWGVANTNEYYPLGCDSKRLRTTDLV